MRKSHLIALFVIFICKRVLAIPVLHQVRPDATFSQIASFEACTLARSSSDAASCNPGLFKRDKTLGVQFSFASVTDGESVDVGRKLIFEPIKEKFLRELFDKNSYNTWGGNTSIDFKTPLFHLYYDPVTVTADVLVLNPAFPEVSMALVKSKRLGITSGYDIIDRNGHVVGVGVNFFYYNRKQYLDAFPLVDLTSTDADELIKFETKSGAAADVGLAYHNPGWLPDVSLLVKNLNSNYRSRSDRIKSERLLWPILLYENYSRLGIGKDFHSDYGAFTVELNAPFEGVYRSYYEDYTTLSGQYTLRAFDLIVGMARFQKSIGIKFSSKSTQVGIFYSQNQPLGDFRHRMERTAGVQLGVLL